MPGRLASARPAHGPGVPGTAQGQPALSAQTSFSRPKRVRPKTEQETKATAVVTMEIERASATIRARGVADDDEDYALPVYAERLPVQVCIGAPEPYPLLAGVERPVDLGARTAQGGVLMRPSPKPTRQPTGRDGRIAPSLKPVRVRSVQGIGNRDDRFRDLLEQPCRTIGRMHQRHWNPLPLPGNMSNSFHCRRSIAMASLRLYRTASSGSCGTRPSRRPMGWRPRSTVASASRQQARCYRSRFWTARVAVPSA